MLALGVTNFERVRGLVSEICFCKPVYERQNGGFGPLALRQGDQASVGSLGRLEVGAEAERLPGARPGQLGAYTPEDGDVGAAKTIDRLLPIADDEKAARLEVGSSGKGAAGPRARARRLLSQQINEVAL